MTSIFLVRLDEDSIISGLTITNGYASAGGGIRSLGSPTIANCVIVGNTADSGGGIYGGDGPIINCVISRNSALYDGGGLAACYGSVDGCIVTGNSAGECGGGMYECYKPTSCVITGNSAGEDGGGIYCYDHLYDRLVRVTNCTLAANVAANYGGGIRSVGYPLISNSIFWANTDSSALIESAQIHAYSGQPEVTFSCIQDDDPCDSNIPFGGADNNNIDDYPEFVRDPNDGGDGWGVGGNDDFGNMHLLSSSPCIDTGSPYPWLSPQSVDMDGQARIMGERIEMGADEFLVRKIAVTRPESGDVWVSGTRREIRWTSCGVHVVRILVSINGDGNWQPIAPNVPSAGSFMWNIPGMVDSNQCIIRIVPTVPDPNVLLEQSGVFTIHQDAQGPLVGSKWESLGGDFTRAGLSENYGPQLGCVKWKFETDGPIVGSTTIGAAERAHVACEDGKLYTLDSNASDPNNLLLWSYDTNSPLLSSPSIGPDGTVYTGAENGKLYVIDANGNVRWTYTTEGAIFSSPAVAADGKVYVGSEDGKLYALRADGAELWTFEGDGAGLSAAVFASPAIGHDGTVYISALYDANLYALDPNDGSVKWVCNFESGGWPFASPVLAPDGTIYQTLVSDPCLYAIDSNNGNILWASHMSDIESGLFEPYYTDYYNTLWCRYEEAAYDVGDSGWSEPVLGPDGTIYLSLDDPNLRAVDPNNGDLKWVTQLGTMGGFTLTVGSDGLIYAAGNDGTLYVVDTDGFEVARFNSDNWLNFPVISADNTVVVAGAADYAMLISHPNNAVWAIGTDCEPSQFDLYWQGGAQDIDGSGFVDFIDYTLLAQNWLECSACRGDPDYLYCLQFQFDLHRDRNFYPGDLNKDRYIDFGDLLLLVDKWLDGIEVQE
ncbi:MAG: outer membrane protein assembly factor BamB family protein [Planctomycetota bacterium]